MAALAGRTFFAGLFLILCTHNITGFILTDSEGKYQRKRDKTENICRLVFQNGIADEKSSLYISGKGMLYWWENEIWVGELHSIEIRQLRNFKQHRSGDAELQWEV